MEELILMYIKDDDNGGNTDDNNNEELILMYIKDEECVKLFFTVEYIMIKKLLRPYLLGIVCFLIAIFFSYQAIITSNLSYKYSFVGFGGTFNQQVFYNIPIYEMCFVIGTVFMFLILKVRAGYYHYKKIQTFIIFLGLIIFGLVGAKLLFIIENLNSIKHTGIRMTLGGVSFFGALFNIPFVIILLNVIKKYDFQRLLDFCTPAGIVMITAMRFGCFLKGCCAGIQVWVNENPLILPVQLIECGFDLILLDIILVLERRKVCDKRLYIVFLCGYSFYRFLLEYIRTSKVLVLNMTNGQVVY